MFIAAVERGKRLGERHTHNVGKAVWVEEPGESVSENRGMLQVETRDQKISFPLNSDDLQRVDYSISIYSQLVGVCMLLS